MLIYVVPVRAQVYEIEKYEGSRPIWIAKLHDQISMKEGKAGETVRSYPRLKDIKTYISGPNDGYWLEF